MQRALELSMRDMSTEEATTSSSGSTAASEANEEDEV
jgi:hypothetical protein